MADGGKSKRPADCRIDEGGFPDEKCRNIREAGGGMRGERYVCDVCGFSIFLDYEDMK